MRIVVYTANIGGFDKVYPVLVKDSNAVFEWWHNDRCRNSIINQILSTGWMPCKANISDFPKAWYTWGNRKLSRYIHINSYKWYYLYFDFAIQHGANVQLMERPTRMVERYLRDNDIAVFHHPHRTTIQQEMNTCIRMGKGNPKIMRKQVQRYLDEGFPMYEYLLSACTVVIWRLNEKVSKFQELWWNEVKNGSVREQLSFDYVRWKLPDVKVGYIPGDLFNNSIIRYHKHG